jgi:hypothetical protein
VLCRLSQAAIARHLSHVAATVFRYLALRPERGETFPFHAHLRIPTLRISRSAEGEIVLWSDRRVTMSRPTVVVLNVAASGRSAVTSSIGGITHVSVDGETALFSRAGYEGLLPPGLAIPLHWANWGSVARVHSQLPAKALRLVPRESAATSRVWP